MNHNEGQYRAQLFDELVYRLLRKVYPEPPAHLIRNAAFAVERDNTTESVSVDFVIDTPNGQVLIETKAPYTNAADRVIHRTLDRLIGSVLSVPRDTPVAKAILAAPVDFSADFLRVADDAGKGLRETRLELWGAQKLRRLTADLLGATMETFSIAELESIVGSHRVSSTQRTTTVADVDRLPVGEQKAVVVLSADFCSFSAFVHASGSNTALISSVMGRFYRESRAAIHDHQGLLDKFIGDGMLCYWFDVKRPDMIEACVARLVGIALNIAQEWQDQIDLSVVPKGLRAGAAVGDVLFIEERAGAIHAVGESINLAARLQSAVPQEGADRKHVAPPNCLVIANRLHTLYFGSREDYHRLGPVDLHNIGSVVCWRKTFVPVADG